MYIVLEIADQAKVILERFQYLRVDEVSYCFKFFL